MSNSHCSLKISPLAIFLPMLAGCATLDGPAVDSTVIDGDVVQYGKWAVGCDNLRICTATALLGDVDIVEGSVYLQMTFTDKISDAQTIALMRDGTMIEGLSPLAAHNLTEDLLGGAGAASVYVAENSVRYSIPREGFAQVVELLGNWRTRPLRRRTATNPVTPLSASRVDNPDIPQTLKGMAKRCPQGHMGDSIQAWRLNGGATLWRAGCGNEGLNSVSFWAVSRPRNEGSEIVVFKDPDQPMESFSKWSKDDGAHQRMPQFGNRNYRIDPYNSWFDDSTGYLRMVHYFGRWDSYQEDCGIYRAYAWNGDGMQLVERRFMPACGTGIAPTGWIVTYRATIFNGPDSGP